MPDGIARRVIPAGALADALNQGWARSTLGPDHPAKYWTLKEYAKLMRLKSRRGG
jgi:hypothetical protein